MTHTLNPSGIRAKAPRRPDGSFAKMMLDQCAPLPPLSVAVAHPVHANAIQAALDGAEADLLVPTLVGPEAKIRAAADAAGLDISPFDLVNSEHSHDAAATACKMAAEGRVQAVMKGALHSDEILSAVIRSRALRTERRISHVYAMDVKTYHKPFLLTDAAISIAPDLSAKVDILQNAIHLWHALFASQNRLPKAALLAAVETVNPSMQVTLDAAALCKMADRGQITDALLDGPLAFDNAISRAAAEEKGIRSEVAGDADILLAPDLEAGNIMGKQMTFFAEAEAAGLVLGARVPVILTSRADSRQTRLLSAALAVLYGDARSRGMFT
ncbi:bifunctional enoyl-CoA hydratase/phosphate acetyltransferase [Yunchengibacter salinarum]|uniref:bifunctional enoyl-CoA hydratase/phosphate acetyltransferase n=1 Tax=Yunchengibacter salinarum TaxID=3133399 RepID=UPI0035B625C7